MARKRKLSAISGRSCSTQMKLVWSLKSLTSLSLITTLMWTTSREQCSCKVLSALPWSRPRNLLLKTLPRTSNQTHQRRQQVTLSTEIWSTSPRWTRWRRACQATWLETSLTRWTSEAIRRFIAKAPSAWTTSLGAPLTPCLMNSLTNASRASEGRKQSSRPLPSWLPTSASTPTRWSPCPPMSPFWIRSTTNRRIGARRAKRIRKARQHPRRSTDAHSPSSTWRCRWPVRALQPTQRRLLTTGWRIWNRNETSRRHSKQNS